MLDKDAFFASEFFSYWWDTSFQKQYCKSLRNMPTCSIIRYKLAPGYFGVADMAFPPTILMPQAEMINQNQYKQLNALTTSTKVSVARSHTRPSTPHHYSPLSPSLYLSLCWHFHYFVLLCWIASHSVKEQTSWLISSLAKSPISNQTPAISGMRGGT